MPARWREQLKVLLEHTTTQTVMVALLVADLLMVIVGSGIEIQYLDSRISDLKAECVGAESGITEAQYEETGHLGLEKAEQITEVLSLYILFLFLMEGCLQVIAHGPLVWLSKKALVFDAVVVIVSIALELQYGSNSELGLILLARMWRYVRLAHGAHEAQHKKAHDSAGDSAGDSAVDSAGDSARRHDSPGDGGPGQPGAVGSVNHGHPDGASQSSLSPLAGTDDEPAGSVTALSHV